MITLQPMFSQVQNFSSLSRLRIFRGDLVYLLLCFFFKSSFIALKKNFLDVKKSPLPAFPNFQDNTSVTTSFIDHLQLCRQNHIGIRPQDKEADKNRKFQNSSFLQLKSSQMNLGTRSPMINKQIR